MPSAASSSSRGVEDPMPATPSESRGFVDDQDAMSAGPGGCAIVLRRRAGAIAQHRAGAMSRLAAQPV